MIKHLYIKDFVLIDEVNLDFAPGFSVFTGETGAGKSILIDAISLLCSQRANASFVAKGKEKTIIEGCFDLTEDDHAKKVLAEAGFELTDEMIFTREIQANGKSSARINHRIVTLSLLRDCLANEIDIHGQRENAYLLNVPSHIHLLDEFLGDKEQVRDTKDAFQIYDRLRKEREQALSETYNENDLEYFTYQIQEIESAQLKPGEDEELEAKEKQYRLLKDSFDKLNTIFSIYDDQLSEPFYELNHMIQGLSGDEKTETVQTAVNDAYYGLSDAMGELHASFDEMDLSEEEINAMEERLFTIQKLKRKYGRTIEDILAKKAELEEQVEAISHRQEYIEKMDRRVQKAKEDYESKAHMLSSIRKDRAHELDEAIAVQLKELMLENARFYTEIKNGEASANGNDRVEFMIAMNKGEDFKPLARTASGGELSRLMLGLKVIFTRLQKVQTVIFDEIDTGVSGPVASAIGRKMKELSKDTQVFSVTHLAQVAACADHHYLVFKSSKDNNTHSTVSLLNEKERIDQLALIASGEITELSRKAARELYRRNQH